MSTVALRAEDLKVVRCEPRVGHDKLASILGFSRPKGVRRLVTRHYGELSGYGDVVSAQVAATGAGLSAGAAASAGGRPGEVVYLNEAQALLVCMFARTNEAAAARKQIVEVFLAYRHGKLVPVGRKGAGKDRDAPWSLMEQRIKRLEKLMAMQDKVETEAFARAVAYAPTILFLDGPNGKRKQQRRPRWWHDREVREACIASHRQMTIDIAVASLEATFGKPRAPSRSSLGRFWKVLDEVRAAS